ncbi:MAG TPA: RidA family protein [Candidatus Mediterraneibacter merdipullorum]|nr:RidA family protein [Candidatus Mediterraneibacter merdipullorum]
MKEKLETTNAPAAIGPYSQAVKRDGLVFVSGQLPIDPKTGRFPSEDVSAQTRQSLENVRAILREGGYEMENVLKTTVFLQDMDDFAAMNEVYAQYFSEPYPARAAFQVAKLPKGAKVEIEVVAK